MAFYEAEKRSIVKTITYRLLIMTSTMVIIFLFTGSLTLTLGVTLLTSIANTLLYYFHERFWNNIYWGKKK
jgi:uncharacterized membrane protein